MELRFIIEERTTQTIGNYLRYERAFSKRLLKKVQYAGTVWQDGIKRRLNDQVQLGELKIILPTELPQTHLRRSQQAIEICYEDDWFIVVNKPAGLLSIPSWQNNQDSLIQRVLAYFEKQNVQGSNAHIVTRLDIGTKGLVLIAKNHYAKQQLHNQKISRRYYAVIQGHLEAEDGEIQLSIRRAEGTRRECHPTGKEACTRYWLKARGEGCDLVELELETGRTHQIRVHMAAIGHPLLGDYLYGDADVAEHPYLQSYALAFMHPVTQQQVTVMLPICKKFLTTCQVENNPVY
ncbi:MAG: RluA family pseudouridine synthase [Culicoidibacterales bacterium]